MTSVSVLEMLRDSKLGQYLEGCDVVIINVDIKINTRQDLPLDKSRNAE